MCGQALPFTALREHCWSIGMRSAYFNSTDSGHPSVPLVLFSNQRHQASESNHHVYVISAYLLYFCSRNSPIMHYVHVRKWIAPTAPTAPTAPSLCDCLPKARRSWSAKRFGISISAREIPQVSHHVSYVSLEFSGRLDGSNTFQRSATSDDIM